MSEWIVEAETLGKLVDGLWTGGKQLVRCKDCKHRDTEDKKCDCGHDIIWQLQRDDDWFCADGGRRDNEQADH